MTVSLQVILFSRLQLKAGGQKLASVLSPRAQRLLVYLLLHRKNPIPRKSLAFTLWPDVAESESLGMLRRALNDLRAGLPGDEDWIVATRAEISWNNSIPFWLDVEEFESQIQRADPHSLVRAAELYAGDLLRDMDEEWLFPERERFQQMQFETLRRLTAHRQAARDFSNALEFTRRALLIDPLSELVYQDRIRLRSLEGDRAAALAEYERLQAILKNELDVEPMEETRALADALMRGESLEAVEGGASNFVRAAALQIPPRLVGRESESAQLAKLWEDAARGRGCIAIVSGEAGIGKSHLARSLASHASQRGGLPLVGYSYEFENTIPYQPIIEMLRPIAHLTRALDLSSAHRSALARLLPEIFQTTDAMNIALSPESLRGQLFEALLQTFILLSQRQPVFMLFEDLHWASESTLDWLTYIAPRLQQDSRLLILLTYRTDEVGAQHSLSRLSRRFEREGVVASVHLDRLTRAANLEWVTHLSGLDARNASLIADRLFTETAGNPFFLQEIVRGMIEAGQIQVEAGRWSGESVWGAAQADIPLPESLRETILARAERLSEMSRAFLQAAVVAGSAFRYEAVQRAGGWGDEIALGALEDLMARGFLREGAAQGTFVFSHHLIREAMYADLTAPRRIYWHRRLAETMQALHPDDFESIAYHFIAAGERDLGIEYSRRAAQRAESLYAYEDASQHLRAALDLVEGEKIETRMTLLESLADNYRLLRQGREAISTYQTALELWEKRGQAQELIGARLYRKIFQTTSGMWETTDFQETELAAQVSAALRAKVNSLLPSIEAEAPHAETARLFQQLAVDALIYRFPADEAKALQYAQAAVNIAEQLNAPVELSSAATTLANVYGAFGLLRERVEAALRALDLSADPRFNDVSARVQILTGAGKALIDIGEYARAAPYLQEAETLAESIRAVHEQNKALSLLHQCWFRLDRWVEMFEVEDRRRAIQQTYPLQRVGAPCFAIGLSAAVHALRGEFEEAKRLHEESFGIMSGVSGPPENWKRSHRY